MNMSPTFPLQESLGYVSFLLSLLLLLSPASSMNYTLRGILPSITVEDSGRVLSDFGRVLSDSPFGPFSPSEETLNNNCTCFFSTKIPKFYTTDHEVAFTMISFNVKDTGHSNSNIALANPGDPVTLLVRGKAEAKSQMACKGCITQFYLRGEDSLGIQMCLGSDTKSVGLNGEVTFMAPKTPGVYKFLIDWSWQFKCNYQYIGSYTNSPVVATLHVAEPDDVLYTPGAAELSRVCDFGYKPGQDAYGQIGSEECELFCSSWNISSSTFFLALTCCLQPFFYAMCVCSYLRSSPRVSSITAPLWSLGRLVLLGGFATGLLVLGFVSECNTSDLVPALLIALVIVPALIATMLAMNNPRRENAQGEILPNSDSIRLYSKPLVSLGCKDGEDDCTECSICMDAFSDEDLRNGVARQLHNCGHVFHEKCLITWVQGTHGYGRTRTCPNCREAVDVKKKKTKKKKEDDEMGAQSSQELEVSVIRVNI
mgnify:CR=1 FL=1